MKVCTAPRIAFIAITLAAAGCTRSVDIAAPSPLSLSPTAVIGGMTTGEDAPAGSGGFAPLVGGFYDGGQVLFIHTEASDPQVAGMLTMMMGPQVVLVPSLAQAPESALGKVYVFTNGVKGEGPFGFQPDVFDSVPGGPEYSPLRAVHLVSWQPGATPRELRSVQVINEAATRGEVKLERSGAVVNMPILKWPEGNR